MDLFEKQVLGARQKRRGRGRERVLGDERQEDDMVLSEGAAARRNRRGRGRERVQAGGYEGRTAEWLESDLDERTYIEMQTKYTWVQDMERYCNRYWPETRALHIREGILFAPQAQSSTNLKVARSANRLTQTLRMCPAYFKDGHRIWHSNWTFGLRCTFMSADRSKEADMDFLQKLMQNNGGRKLNALSPKLGLVLATAPALITPLEFSQIPSAPSKN